MKITRENLEKHLLEEQLKIVEKELVDTLKDSWRFDNTLTTLQKEEFEKYSIKLIKKVLKCNKSKAQAAFDKFFSLFGLRLKN